METLLIRDLKPALNENVGSEKLLLYKSSCLNLIVVQVTVTSEDVFWSIRNVKFLNESFYNMRCVVMLITAVCLIFLLKLKWPKNKSVYDLVITTSYPTRANGVIVLVNSQTVFCRRFLFPQFYKASGKKILKLGALFCI